MVSFQMPMSSLLINRPRSQVVEFNHTFPITPQPQAEYSIFVEIIRTVREHYIEPNAQIPHYVCIPTECCLLSTYKPHVIVEPHDYNSQCNDLVKAALGPPIWTKALVCVCVSFNVNGSCPKMQLAKEKKTHGCNSCACLFSPLSLTAVSRGQSGPWP